MVKKRKYAVLFAVLSVKLASKCPGSLYCSKMIDWQTNHLTPDCCSTREIINVSKEIQEGNIVIQESQ